MNDRDPSDDDLTPPPEAAAGGVSNNPNQSVSMHDVLTNAGDDDDGGYHSARSSAPESESSSFSTSADEPSSISVAASSEHNSVRGLSLGSSFNLFKVSSRTLFTVSAASRPLILGKCCLFAKWTYPLHADVKLVEFIVHQCYYYAFFWFVWH